MPKNHPIRKWRSVPDWEGIYEVSNYGEVRRINRTRWANPRLIKPQINKRDGYLYVGLRDGKRYRWMAKVHRLVLLAFRGSPPSPEHECRHLNNNRRDARLTNLRWGTRKQNARDKITHGTHVFGERHGMAKLTEEDVLNIRFLANTTQQIEIARRYNMSRPQICTIIKRKAWKHI